MQVLSFIIMSALIGSCSNDPVKADPHTMRLHVQANELYTGRQFSRAAALLRGTTFPPSLALRAKAEYFAGDLDMAEKTFRQQLKVRPGNFEAKLYLARILRERGEEVKAQQLIEDLLADYPHDMRLLRLAANIALDKGDFAGASAFLDQGAEMTADGALILLDRARLNWIAGRGSEALEDLRRARSMLPWDTPVARSINQLEENITEAMK